MKFRSSTAAFLLMVLTPAIGFAQGTSARSARKKPAKTAQRPIALVYNGPGSCVDESLERADQDLKDAINDCSVQAAVVARKAGFKVKFVGPEAVNDESTPEQVNALFEQGRVWIQPGGNSGEAFDSMSETLMNGLTRFVRSGGGYVGFCAGAFMATEFIGKKGAPGLGLFPGTSIAFPHGSERPDLDYSLEPVIWNGVKRAIFLQGGPYLILPEGADAEVIATYESGAAAAARTRFGRGRVFITGLHPEAPLRWTQEDHVVDPDGVEQNLAAEMVKWAASPAAVKMPAPDKLRAK